MNHTIGRWSRAVLGRFLPVLALAGLLSAVLTAPAHAELPDGGWGERHLDEVTLLGSHNGYANGPDGMSAPFTNQTYSLRDQLWNQGVRATELDVYDYSYGTGDDRPPFARTGHGEVFRQWGRPLADHLRTIVDFLNSNRQEVFVLTLEDNASKDLLAEAFDSVPGARSMMFDPHAWRVDSIGWPRVQDMVNTNQRLLVLSGKVDREDIGIFPMRDWTIQNHYDNGIRQCTDRSGDGISDPLDVGGRYGASGQRAFQKLFFNNQFSSRTYDDFYQTVKTACESATHGRMPNMISTDWIGYDNQDAWRFVNDTDKGVGWNVGGRDLCLDVEGGRSDNGTPVQIYSCNWTNSQAWSRVPILKQNVFEMRAFGKCLDVAGGSTANGTRVQLYDCNGTGSQLWWHDNRALRNPMSGKCLDVPSGDFSPGRDLQLYDCNGMPSQAWDWRMV
ncbi:RICIN domain-containing protein [Streptomyces sp. NPDC093149]|uniref:RICIN domain-containing protein n=1 Tax=Streptomyces sp. NPDC093149 TaxID=3366031 RepID=UPI0038045C64